VGFGGAFSFLFFFSSPVSLILKENKLGKTDSFFLFNCYYHFLEVLPKLLQAALGKVEHKEPNAEFAACTWKQFSRKELDSCSDRA